MRIPRKLYIGVASMLVAAGAIVGLLSLTSTSADAMTITSRQDCGYTDPIIDCGVVSTDQLLERYDANDDRRGNKDVQAIFNNYGVTRSDITNESQIKHGWLNHVTGEISVNGTVVATNAQSLYRVNVPDKTLRPVSIAGKTYYIGAVAGQYSKGADVYVFVNRDGTFRTAIQASCGNPIPATPKTPPKPPTPKPVYSCDSLTARKIERNKFEFTSSATATNGAEIVSYNYDFGDGTKLSSTDKISHTYAKAGTYNITMTVNIKVDGRIIAVPGDNCNETVTVEEEKVPVFACESLKISDTINRTEFKFTATASAENATIKSYTFDFGDSKNETVTTSAKTASATHTYPDKAGTYTAKVTVTMSDGKTAPSTKNCEVTVTVKEKEAPSIEIVKTVNGKEHIKVDVGTEFTYEITVKNTGNVTLKDALVTDDAPKEVTLLSSSLGTIKNNQWTYTIAELKAGQSKSFTIKAKYAKYAGGTHENKVCVDTPTIPGKPDDCDEATTETHEKIEVCDLNDNTVKTIERSEFDESHMTTDLSKCGDMEVCIISDKTTKTIAIKDYDQSTMTTDFSKCEETPPELPKTGLDMFIGGGLGLGSITAAGYYWSASRRNLLDALLNK